MLWDDMKAWLYRPFQEPGDPVNWLLLTVITATAAYMWSRVLDKVLEE